jgi:hypothetical protein
VSKEMPQQMDRRAPIGSLFKRPMERARRSRKAREESPTYLALIRQLPCLKCGMEPCGVAAHVRLNSAAHGKRQAMGQKPDDKWAVPLCAGCHTQDADAQHKVGEMPFWYAVGINPLLACERLQHAAPDVVAMRAVVFRLIAERIPD